MKKSNMDVPKKCSLLAFLITITSLVTWQSVAAQILCDIVPNQQRLAFPESLKTDDCLVPLRVKIASKLTKTCGDPPKLVESVQLTNGQFLTIISNFSVLQRNQATNNVEIFTGCLAVQNSDQPVVKLLPPRFSVVYNAKYADCRGSVGDCEMEVAVSTDHPPQLVTSAWLDQGQDQYQYQDSEETEPETPLLSGDTVQFDCTTLTGTRKPRKVRFEVNVSDTDPDDGYSRLVEVSNSTSMTVTFVDLQYNNSRTQREVDFENFILLPRNETRNVMGSHARWTVSLDEADVCNRADFINKPAFLISLKLLENVDRSKAAVFSVRMRALFSLSVRSGMGKYVLSDAVNFEVMLNITKRIADWSFLNLTDPNTSPTRLAGPTSRPIAVAVGDEGAASLRVALVAIGAICLLAALGVCAMLLLRRRGSFTITSKANAINDNPDGRTADVNVRLQTDGDGTYSEVVKPSAAGGYRPLPSDDRQRGLRSQPGNGNGNGNGHGPKTAESHTAPYPAHEDEDTYCHIGNNNNNNGSSSNNRQLNPSGAVPMPVVYASARK